ncbi:6264_t:CDS:2, partial [Funneliformis caledonium]
MVYTSHINAGLSERQIARNLGISKSTVHRVYYLFKKYGCVKNILTLRGRPRIFGNDDMKYLEVLLKEKRAIHRLGYTHKQLSKPAQERKENERAEFILRISHEHCARKATFFIRGQKFTIEGALCVNGLLAYSIQEGLMKSNDYEYFIENIL